MKADFFYRSAPGRACLLAMERMGMFTLMARLMHTRASKCLIPGYIKHNRIDMTPFAGQRYDSFAAFFTRRREDTPCAAAPDALISPCDGLLSMYAVTEDMTVPMKGSAYALTDLLPDEALARQYQNGLCLVFRLEASDYHHFCAVDDGRLTRTHYIPGRLHSVQPIALRHVPVFRLNRRWWSVLETERFGAAVQIEVGAMAVGGVTFYAAEGRLQRGREMGCFELAGSTILLLLRPEAALRLTFLPSIAPAMNGETEVRVAMAAPIAVLSPE